jgi:hypothetical protein
MIDIALAVIVTGTIALALGVDLAALVGSDRSRALRRGKESFDEENCKSGATIAALNRSGKSEATIETRRPGEAGYASAESPRAGACRCGRSNSAWPQRFDARRVRRSIIILFE